MSCGYPPEGFIKFGPRSCFYRRLFREMVFFFWTVNCTREGIVFIQWVRVFSHKYRDIILPLKISHQAVMPCREEGCRVNCIILPPPQSNFKLYNVCIVLKRKLLQVQGSDSVNSEKKIKNMPRIHRTTTYDCCTIFCRCYGSILRMLRKTLWRSFWYQRSLYGT